MYRLMGGWWLVYVPPEQIVVVSICTAFSEFGG